MYRLIAPVSLALLCGCPNVVNLPPDAGAASFVGRSCNVDAECGPVRCDKIRHQCICLSDESCNTGDPFAAPKYCNNYTGLCVSEISGCTSDSACGATEYCDPSIRSCRALKSFCAECSGNNECGGAGDNCIADPALNKHFCGTACNATIDCPRGATCQAKDGVNQCWPDKTPAGAPATCNDFRGCTPDSLRTCNTTAECGDASQRCDLASGKCVAVQQVCPFGTTCDPRGKICVANCVVDTDCGSATLRCVDRVCQPANECANDNQCPSNKVCSIPPGGAVGACVPFCQTDVDCPLGAICQQVGVRYSCAPGCRNNAGCPLDQRCNSTTSKCEGPVVGTARICQATQACATCQLCDGLTNTCQSAKAQYPGYCQPCAGVADCSGQICVTSGTESFCAPRCGLGGECPQGFACLSLVSGDQACVPSDRTCVGKCP